MVWDNNIASRGERQAVQRGEMLVKGVEVWDMDIKNHWGAVGSVGKRSHKKHTVPRQNCCNHLEGKHTT